MNNEAEAIARCADDVGMRFIPGTTTWFPPFLGDYADGRLYNFPTGLIMQRIGASGVPDTHNMVRRDDISMNPKLARVTALNLAIDAVEMVLMTGEDKSWRVDSVIGELHKIKEELEARRLEVWQGMTGDEKWGRA